MKEQNQYKGDQHIEVEEFPLLKKLGEGWNKYIESLQPYFEGDIPLLLASRLHKCSECIGTHHFGSERPVSAFYAACEKKLVIIWGKINAQREAKLHDYLINDPLYRRLQNDARTIRSGHLAEINLPGLDNPLRVALFDSLLRRDVVDKNRPEYPMLISLLSNQIVPITSNGHLVQLLL